MLAVYLSYKFEPITARRRLNLRDTIEMFRAIEDEDELLNDISINYEKKKPSNKK